MTSQVNFSQVIHSEQIYSTLGSFFANSKFVNLNILTDSLSFVNISNYRIFHQAFPVTTLKIELNIPIFFLTWEQGDL